MHKYYGVATMSRRLKMIGLFCRISPLVQGSFAKETCHFKEPTCAWCARIRRGACAKNFWKVSSTLLYVAHSAVSWLLRILLIRRSNMTRPLRCGFPRMRPRCSTRRRQSIVRRIKRGKRRKACTQVQHHSYVRVSWGNYLCDTTYLYVRYGSCMCACDVTRMLFCDMVCDMACARVRDDAFRCATWLMYAYG